MRHAVLGLIVRIENVPHGSCPRSDIGTSVKALHFLNSLAEEENMALKKVRITEASNNLRALINGVGDGSPVLIVDRGRPVARLEPVGAGPGASPSTRSITLATA